MFAKIFLQIFDSSLADDPNVRHMFMDLLVLADKDGVVDMTLSAISARTRLAKKDVARWIAALERPDPASRSPDMGGCRIVRLDAHRDWGWRIVNFSRYRETASKDMLRMSERDRKAEWRKRRGLAPSPTPPSSKDTEAKADTEADAEAEKSHGCPDMSVTCPGQNAKTPRKSQVADATWLASLEQISAYSHVNLKHELEKASVWCDERRRKLTRRFFLNWINRVERPMTNGKASNPRNDCIGGRDLWTKQHATIAAAGDNVPYGPDSTPKPGVEPKAPVS